MDSTQLPTIKYTKEVYTNSLFEKPPSKKQKIVLPKNTLGLPENG
jgi:hypothetical protein